MVGVFSLYAYGSGDYHFHVTGDSSLSEPAILVEDCDGGESVVAGADNVGKDQGRLRRQAQLGFLGRMGAARS